MSDSHLQEPTLARPKLTETDMLAMLARRYGETAGNGPAWAFVTGVRDAAGFDAKRTLDAVAMGLWPSRGLHLHGFEVKCSRSDWQRELKNPAKAERFCCLLDFFWLVVSDAKIVQDGELPPTWGLLAARGGKLVQVKAATAIRPFPVDGKSAPLPEAIGRSFIASLLRAAGATRERTPSEVKEAVEVARSAGRQEGEREGRQAQLHLERLRAAVREFEQASGLQIGRQFNYGNEPADLGRAVMRLLTDERELDRQQERLERLRGQARDTLAQLDRLADKYAEQLSLGTAA